LSYLIPDIRIVDMSLIIDQQTAFEAEFVAVCVFYDHTEFRILISSGTLVIASKLRAKYVWILCSHHFASL
jgi:hypothetical protein